MDIRYFRPRQRLFERFSPLPKVPSRCNAQRVCLWTSLYTLKRLKGSSGCVVDFVEKTWLSTHYKILDIARPLIQLWGSLPPAHSHLQQVVSALRLWEVAFRDVTMNRRKNILRQTAPDFLNVLSDPNMFSNREISRLFGVHFLNAMAKETDEENKIAKVRRSGGHSHRSLLRYLLKRSSQC